ncbi:MAG: hypothetical protein Q8O40_17795 [Chloroflexota bacterium]|nr:hypothetical protein [Chloroflexota bacterium]
MADLAYSALLLAFVVGLYSVVVTAAGLRWRLPGHLVVGQTSVGYEVNVRRLAPTPIGQRVRCAAEVLEVLEVQGNKVLFKVEAYDEQKKIGEGTHRRAIVDRGPARQS